MKGIRKMRRAVKICLKCGSRARCVVVMKGEMVYSICSRCNSRFNTTAN